MRLSLCILTYNRSRFLVELLDSIVAQDSIELEVIIADDASPDETSNVVAPYQSRFKRFLYFRHPVNVGIDRNFIKAVDLASGDYIWLMGDDDRLEPGAVRRVLHALDEWPQVVGMTIGVIDYDSTMSHPVGVRRMPPTQVMKGADTVFGEIADLLGFMSALVIDRRKWNRVVQEEPVLQYDKYYLQVFVIGRVIQRFGPWAILNVPCVDFRSSNDQFLDKFGWLDRLTIDIVAYEQIFRALFADDPTARHRATARIFSSHVVGRIRNAKTSQPVGFAEAMKTTLLLRKHYWQVPALWTHALPTLWMPRSLVKLSRRLYRRYSLTSGTARARAIVRTGDAD